jgi:AraC-like DNA-binding protein
MNSWEILKAVQRMQDHIEEHLEEPLTLSDLAKCARYSPWYAARLFKECTGKTPFEYIRLRRLSAAAVRIETTSARVVSVAFDFLFDSHDGFTRAFAKQFGLTPSRFRELKTKVSPFMPLQARDYYCARQKGQVVMQNQTVQSTVFVQIVDHPARKLIVKRGRTANHYFEYCEEVGCDIWEVLGRVEGALREPMGMWLPERLRPAGTSTYVQGVEVPNDFVGAVPSGYEVIELGPCKMMVFQGPPFDDKDFSQAIASLWDCINAYKPELYGFAWADDDAPRFQLAPLGYRGYIEGRPVRAA